MLRFVDIARLGFTGTRFGMTSAQRASLRERLLLFKPVEFHHGDCVGADAQAHELVRKVLPKCKIVGHPGPATSLRAYCKCDEVLIERPYLVRDRTIVESTDALIATPKTAEEGEGGTWYTVGYARGVRKPNYVIEPIGVIVVTG